jgi:hypothetical protein
LTRVISLFSFLFLFFVGFCAELHLSRFVRVLRMEPKGILLERNARLSHSLLWSWMREFYENAGLPALFQTLSMFGRI